MPVCTRRAYVASFGGIMKDVKGIVAANISALRQANNMTQLELAQRLNYSDKTISKWERGESAPDVSVLVEMAELFGVTLDYMVTDGHDDVPTVPIRGPKHNRRAIAYICESGGWMIAILAFIITTLVFGKMSFQYLYFLYALPVVLVVKLVFNSIWFNPRHNYLIISVLVWSALAAVHITFLYFGINISVVYLLGIAGQIVIILWSFVSKPKNK